MFLDEDYQRTPGKTPTGAGRCATEWSSAAESRGIGDGDEVRVVCVRGAARFRARVSADTRPGVVVAEGLWWHRFQPGG